MTTSWVYIKTITVSHKKHALQIIIENFTVAIASMSKNNFEFQYVIGKGGFGKVWRVKYLKTRQIFAMKEMSKARIITKRSVASVMSEKKLLEKL